MEFISERVSIDRRPERFSVVISPRLSPGRRNMLIAWVLLWTASGVLIFLERRQLPVGDPVRQYLLAFLAFWAYFEIRVVRALLWRLKGFELWRVKEGVLTVKDSILGFGNAHRYFVQNIQKLGLIVHEKDSFKQQLNESFWVIGGERIGFEHLGRKVVLGKGLNEEEAKRLVVELKEVVRAGKVK
jgi:hypothetical protein